MLCRKKPARVVEYEKFFFFKTLIAERCARMKDGKGHASDVVKFQELFAVHVARHGDFLVHGKNVQLRTAPLFSSTSFASLTFEAM